MLWLWLWIVACGAPMKSEVAIKSHAGCHDAYTAYEIDWRTARTAELQEFVAHDEGVLEEILYYELATLPSRVEVEKLREIYAVVDAFLWNAPWPRALAAAETAIQQCGEQAPRSSVAVITSPR